MLEFFTEYLIILYEALFWKSDLRFYSDIID